MNHRSVTRSGYEKKEKQMNSLTRLMDALTALRYQAEDRADSAMYVTLLGLTKLAEEITVAEGRQTDTLNNLANENRNLRDENLRLRHEISALRNPPSKITTINISAEVEKLIRAGQKIPAIKLLRDEYREACEPYHSTLGLADAKNAVEAYMDAHGIKWRGL